MAKTKRIQIRIGDETHAKLEKRRQKENRVSISDIARVLIEKGLKQ